MEQNIPKHWKLVKLNDLILTQKGKKPQTLKNKAFEGSLPYLDINALENNKIIQYADIPSSLLSSEKDLLIVWDGSRSGLIMKAQVGAVGSTLMLITPFVDANYLFYFLQYKFEYLNRNTTGDSIPHVNSAIFDNLQVPITSLPEQKRIVISLEKELNDITQKLNENKTKLADLKIYQQSVLEDAVSGKLTEEWRRKVQDIVYNKQLKSDIEPDLLVFKNTSIPESWIIVSISTFATFQQGMQIAKNQRFTTPAIDRLPLLRIKNYADNFASDVEYIAVNANTLIADEKDIIIARTGETRGKILTGVKGVFHNNTFRINFDEHIIMREYLINVLESSFIQGFIIQNTLNGSHPDLSHSIFKKCPVPITSIEEQAEIVRIVEEKLKQVDELQKIYAAEIEKSAKLRQAILQRAFEGDLSELQEGDESVDDLLERVKEAKKTYELNIQQKKKMTTNTTQRILLNKLSIMIEERLVEIYDDREYSAEELHEIAVFFAESNYKLVDDNGKINFEDFANAFDELIRKTKINMYFNEGKIYYQNNFTPL